MTQHNKRLQVPRYAPLSPAGVRRKPFLDGTAKVYMGPEQDLWSMPEQWLFPPDTGTVGLQPYVPPADWSKEGLLLRVPQVVHFSPIGSLENNDYLSLFGSFVGAVEALKKIRAGRTWGFVIDWFDYLARYGTATTQGFTVKNKIAYFDPVKGEVVGAIVPVTLFKSSTFASYFTDKHWLHMVAPQAGTPKFFGCNYFHIYAGSANFEYFQRPGDITSETVIDLPIFGVGSDNYNYSRAKVTSNYDSFAGYACKLFGAEGDPVQVGIGNVDFLKASAIDLQSYGFTYAGGTALLPDTASVMKVIGDYFHFDPVTGKDLPFG